MEIGENARVTGTTRDLEAELDARLQQLSASGFSRAGILAQLTLAGYPVELLRHRFPEFPDIAFGLALPATPTVVPQGRATPPRAARA